MIIFGYKSGFLKRAMGIVSGLIGTIISFFLAKPFGKFLYHHVDFIRKGVYYKILPVVDKKISKFSGEPLDTAVDSLGLPDFIDKIIVDWVGEKLVDENTVINITTSLTKVALIMIGFLILFILFSIGLKILKAVVESLREHSETVYFLDGLLGIVFNVLIYLIFVYVALIGLSTLLSFTGTSSGFGAFIARDMQLNNNNFRISKYLYEYNILGNIFKMFF